MIHCSRCKEDKDPDEFMPSQRRPGSWCRACMAEYYRREFDRTPRECGWCRSDFVPVHPAQRFCQRSHKISAAKARHARGTDDKRFRRCSVCGSALSVTDRADKLYCSGRCALAARRIDGRSSAQKRRQDRLRYLYSITIADYEAMLVEQEGRCAICRRSEPRTHHGFWAVDHCHRTGKVRGLLCGPCNAGIGQLQDDPAVLSSAIRYLEAATDYPVPAGLLDDEPVYQHAGGPSFFEDLRAAHARGDGAARERLARHCAEPTNRK